MSKTLNLTGPPKAERAQGETLEKLRERVHWFETNDAERFAYDEPVDAIALYNELLEDYENAKPKYYEKRIRLYGTVTKIGSDEFGAPSFEFTDAEKKSGDIKVERWYRQQYLYGWYQTDRC